MPCRPTAKLIFLLSLLCLVFLPNGAQCQEDAIRWRKLAFDPLVSSLYDCALVSDTVAIVVGEDGVIRRGTEISSLVVRHGQGGLPTWFYVGWYSDSVLVCAGDDGAIGWSHDLGLTWSTESAPGVDRVVSVVRAGKYALLATQRGVYRYLPGTESVELVINRPSVGVGFDNNMHVAALSDGEVLRSSDDGKTWTRDSSLSTLEPLVRLRKSNGILFFVHKRFITWIQQDGRSDTTYIPSSIMSFEYSDVASIATRFYFTGAPPTGRHAYSLDGGDSLTVASGFAINATNSTVVSNSRLLCVGFRGSIVLTHVDSAITDRFRLFGFQPSVTGRSAYTFERLIVSPNDLRVVSSQPKLAVLDTNARLESIVADVIWHGTLFRHASWIDGRTSVLVDTSADVTYPDGVRKKSRYILYTKHDSDNEWSRYDSPSWGIGAFNAKSVGDGTILFTGFEQQQLYSLIPSNGRLDSVSMPVSATLVYADDSILIFRGLNEYLVMNRESMTYETRPNPVAGESLIAMGRDRRLFVIATVMSGSGLDTRYNQVVRYSDDLGVTWTTAFDKPLPDRLSSVLDLYADSAGRIAFVGVGEGIAWSQDNGVSWKIGRLPNTAQSAKSIVFVQPNTIVVAGNNELLHIGQLATITTVNDEQNLTSSPDQPELKMVRLQAFDLLGRQQGSTDVSFPLSVQYMFERLRLTSGIYLFEGSLPSGALIRGRYIVP